MKRPVARFVTSALCSDQFPSDGLPEVAFLGRSNVGKSSLLNALLGQPGLARVSSTPGRTQAVNFFRAGDRLYFADLPGYGFARVPERVRRSWDALARSYLVGRAPLALCVLLLDARHAPNDDDRSLRTFLDATGLRYVVAATKSDKLGRGELARQRELLSTGLSIDPSSVVTVSAKTGTGIAELWRVVQAATAPARPRGHSGGIRT